VTQQPGVAGVDASASQAAEQEVLITYGEKDNRWGWQGGQATAEVYAAVVLGFCMGHLLTLLVVPEL
jgi:hypothetical protein